MLIRSKVAFIVILLGMVFLGGYVYNWQSPGVNYSSHITIHQSIYTSNKKHNLQLQSFDNEFDIAYVENSRYDTLNPYFPSIHITTKAKHNAWLHVVYSDRKDDEDNKIFVDAPQDCYPFYALVQDFYDAPVWNYTLRQKPLSYWKGHVWAVDVDYENKTIKPIGGVSWGFNLSYFRIKPICITPFPLNQNHWKSDWNIFKTKFDQFTSYYL